MRSTWIPAACVAALLTPVHPVHAEGGLALHYGFQEGAGEVVHDGSGFRHDGRITGNAQWVQQEDHRGLRCNGTDTSVEVPFSPTLTPKQSMVIDVWSRPKTVQAPKLQMLTPARSRT